MDKPWKHCAEWQKPVKKLLYEMPIIDKSIQVGSWLVIVKSYDQPR